MGTCYACRQEVCEAFASARRAAWYLARMSDWTACAFGELSLPEGALARWRVRVADASRHSDWPYRDAVPEAALPVAKLLAEIEQLGRRGNHVDLVESPERISLRALFTGETTLWCQTIALALREAAAVGAQGEVTFVDATEPAPSGPLEGEVLRLEVREGKSRFRRLRGAEAAVVRGDPHAIATVMEIIGASVTQPKSSRR